MMKSLQCLLFLVIIATIQCWSDEGKRKIRKYTNECIEETGVDRKTIEEDIAKHEYPNEPEFKRFLYCFGMKNKAVDDEGRLDPDGFKKSIAHEGYDQSVALEILEKCSIVRDTPEDTTYSVFICYQQLAPDDIKFLYYVNS